MQINVNYRDMSKTDAIQSHVGSAIEHDLGRFDERLTRVEVHLTDENAHKKGPGDKRVMLEARPKGMDPIAVSHRGEDLYKTVTEAAGKLKRALEHKFEKHDSTG